LTNAIDSSPTSKFYHNRYVPGGLTVACGTRIAVQGGEVARLSDQRELRQSV
jgi:hypothetical protein